MAEPASSPTFAAQAPAAAQLSPPAAAAAGGPGSISSSSVSPDDISTIFVVGFPDDVHEREFQNMFLFASGFEASMLKLPSPEDLADAKKQTIGFAKFRTRLEAQRAKDHLNGKKVDSERSSVLKVEMAKKNLHVKRCHTQLQSAAGSDAASPTSADNSIGQATSSFDALLLRRARVVADQTAARADSASRSPQLQTARRPLEVDVVGPGNGIDHLLADFHLAGPKSAPLVDSRNILLSEMRSLSTSPVAGTSSSVAPAAAQLPLSPLSIFATFPSLSGPANGPRSPLAATSTTSPLSPGLTGSSALAGQAAFAGTTPRATTVLDQNPLCNTIYVGNLSSNASEEELRRMFSACPGYKRMSFKVKANGPLCFVEFEDVGFATQALQRLQGTLLSTSVKGGIRLSYSKNPLGVRTQKPTLNVSTGRTCQSVPAGPASAPAATNFSPFLGRDFIASALSRSALRENWTNMPNVPIADSSLSFDASSPAAAAALANVMDLVRGPGDNAVAAARSPVSGMSQAFGPPNGAAPSPRLQRLTAILNRDNGEGAANGSFFSGIVGER